MKIILNDSKLGKNKIEKLLIYLNYMVVNSFCLFKWVEMKFFSFAAISWCYIFSALAKKVRAQAIPITAIHSEGRKTGIADFLKSFVFRVRIASTSAFFKALKYCKASSISLKDEFNAK